MNIDTTLPCYEVAENVTEGQIIRLKTTTPGEGLSYVTIATKDPALQGQFQPGKSYKVVITEA